MGHSADKRFEFRFKKGIEVVYRTRPIDGEERQLNQQKLSDAVRAVMASVLKREPTPEELLGIIPIAANVKNGAA